MRSTKRFLFVLSIPIIVLGCKEERKVVSSPVEGDLAPNFTLPATSGEEITLHAFQGQKQVVLYFYPKDDTPGCTKEACSFRDNIESIEGKDAVILGVSRDSLESHRAFIDKFGLPFVLLSDTDGDVCRTYEVLIEKENGTSSFNRSTFVIGKDGKIKKIFRNVNVENHTEEVLSALE